MSETTNTNTAPKLTGRAKLVANYESSLEKYKALGVKLNELAAEINAIDALAAVTVGSKVIVTVGKGEAAKEVEAVVVGVREEEDGSKTLKVQYGEGFDADIAVVKASKVKLPAAEGEAAAAEAAQG